MLKVGLAQVQFPNNLVDALQKVDRMIQEAGKEGCHVICFPESIVPGLRGVGFPVMEREQAEMETALRKVQDYARRSRVGVILPMEWEDEDGFHLIAYVIDENGSLLGYQTKNQIDPGEEPSGFVPGRGRRVFTIHGVTVGIIICHEGWRYPETVRWAALQGAKLVFHPHFSGAGDDPEFFKPIQASRARENNIFFASVNYALEEQGAYTCMVDPHGLVLGQLPLSEEQLLIVDVDPAAATGQLASRFRPELLVEVN